MRTVWRNGLWTLSGAQHVLTHARWRLRPDTQAQVPLLRAPAETLQKSCSVARADALSVARAAAARRSRRVVIVEADRYQRGDTRAAVRLVRRVPAPTLLALRHVRRPRGTFAVKKRSRVHHVRVPPSLPSPLRSGRARPANRRGEFQNSDPNGRRKVENKRLFAFCHIDPPEPLVLGCARGFIMEAPSAGQY